MRFYSGALRVVNWWENGCPFDVWDNAEVGDTELEGIVP